MPVEGPPRTALARLGKQAAGEGRRGSESLLMHDRHLLLLLVRLLLLLLVVPSGSTSLYARASHGVHFLL